MNLFPAIWRTFVLFGVSRATLSPDFNTMTVENEIPGAAGGRQPGKATEVWVRK